MVVQQGKRVWLVALAIVALVCAVFPSFMTGAAIASQETAGRLCNDRVGWPIEGAPERLDPEGALNNVQTKVIAPAAVVECRYQGYDGHVFYESRVHTVHPAGVVTSYLVAVLAVSGVWVCARRRPAV